MSTPLPFSPHPHRLPRRIPPRLPRLQALWEGTRQLLLPEYCAGCGSPGQTWCPTCHAHLTSPPRRIHTRVHTIAPVWALAPYSGPVADGIVDYKEHRRTALAPYLGAALAHGIGQLVEAGEVLGPHFQPLFLVPAPSTVESLRTRGFSHVRLMAENCAQHLGETMRAQGAEYPIVVADIVQIGSHPDSVGLTADQRQEALTGAVTVAPGWQGERTLADPQHWRGQTPEIVLIDDVVTTGVTVSECFLALAQTGLRPRGALIVATA